MRFLFFFNDTATTEIYTLSLHDALPIFVLVDPLVPADEAERFWRALDRDVEQHGAPNVLITVSWHTRSAREIHERDRKSTRLNSSHANISYAVFCLKKKKTRLNSSDDNT